VCASDLLAYSAASFYLVDPSTDQILVMPGAPPAVQQTISVGQGLINFAASPSVQRFYAISQLVPSGTCNTPASVSTAGQVSAVETTTNTVSNVIPVGVCPVYGVMSPDGKRAFILIRVSGTVTVIDSQKNVLDTTSSNVPGGTITFDSGSGPVYASIVPNSNLLVTANYDGNSISIIDITTDVYSNDAATFGKVIKTIPVGTHPVSVTVLADGSRAYVANQADGTVSVVNMTTLTVDKTITVNGHPHTVVSAQDSIFGKVYVFSPDSKYCTIIRTDQNIVTTSILLPGYGVDVRMSQISSTLSNRILTSRISGSGQP
jgi:YVTN family beta-propeller protein